MVRCVSSVDTGCNRVAAGTAALSCALFVLQRFALKDVRVLRYAKWTLLVVSPLVVAGGQVWSRMSEQSSDDESVDNSETVDISKKEPMAELKPLPEELNEKQIYALADECLGKGVVSEATTEKELVAILKGLEGRLNEVARDGSFEKLVKTAVCAADLTFVWLFKKYNNAEDPHEHVAWYIVAQKPNWGDENNPKYPIAAYKYICWPAMDYNKVRANSSEGFFTEGHENYRAREVYNRYAEKMWFVVQRIQDDRRYGRCCPVDNDPDEWYFDPRDMPT